VGRLVSAELNAPFADPDQEIVRRTGLSVPALFAARGESGFRELEREVMSELLEAPPRIIAPGGGWAAQPGVLDDVAGRALVIHLVVTPRTAHDRLGDATGRPLLAGGVLRRLRELEALRIPYYRQAETEVETDGRPPAKVAADVVALARSQAGW
jgi:shikimate kinase